MKGIMTILPSLERGATEVTMDDIRECPRCRTMTMFFRNVRGVTYCYRCAPRDENQKED